MTGKICSHCKQPGEFFKDRTRPDGIHSWCKLCHKKSNKPEDKRAAGKRYATKHKEQRKQYVKRWNEENAERISAQKQIYYQLNREARLAKNTEYRKSPRGRALSCERTNRRKRVMEQATPKWADLFKTQLIYQQAAEVTTRTGIPHEVDHTIPLVSKVVCGLHWHENLQVLTEKENSAKRNKFSGG